MKEINQLLDKMWTNYIEMTPQAKRIVDLLEKNGEHITNDHIALRTFNLPKVCIDVIAKPFLDTGYVEGGEYHFEEKKLYAKHFEHSDKNLPKVFISQLLVEKFSKEFQNIISKKIEVVSNEAIKSFDLMTQGTLWDASIEEYEILQKESDYAAWLIAIGYRPNHFTIFFNALKGFEELKDLNTFLKDNGFKLNASGGEIKGSKEVCLEQSSTLADNIVVKFTDGELTIPSCYFEFARRYENKSGDLYQGFVATSADKIFESTDKGQ